MVLSMIGDFNTNIVNFKIFVFYPCFKILIDKKLASINNIKKIMVTDPLMYADIAMYQTRV